VRRRIETTRFDTPEARAASAHSIWIHHRALLASDEVLERLGALIERAARPVRDERSARAVAGAVERTG
jgi:hypothetical protein